MVTININILNVTVTVNGDIIDINPRAQEQTKLQASPDVSSPYRFVSSLGQTTAYSKALIKEEKPTPSNEMYQWVGSELSKILQTEPECVLFILENNEWVILPEGALEYLPVGTIVAMCSKFEVMAVNTLTYSLICRRESFGWVITDEELPATGISLKGITSSVTEKVDLPSTVYSLITKGKDIKTVLEYDFLSKLYLIEGITSTPVHVDMLEALPIGSVVKVVPKSDSLIDIQEFTCSRQTFGWVIPEDSV